MKKVLEKISDNYIIFCVYALIGWIYEVSWYLIVRNTFVNRGVLFGPFLPIYGFGVLILLVCLKKFMSKKHLSSNILDCSVSLAVIITFIFVTIIDYTQPKIYNIMTFLNKYGVMLLLINLIVIFITNYLIQKSNKKSKIRKVDVTVVLVFLLIWLITTLIEYVSHLGIDILTGKMLWDYSNDFLNFNSRICWDASRNFAIGGTFLLYIVQPLVNKLLVKVKANKKILFTVVVGIIMIIDFLVNVIFK